MMSVKRILKLANYIIIILFVHGLVHGGLLEIAVSSQGYEGGLANFHQRLSQNEEPRDPAVPATVSRPAVPDADEWRAVATGPVWLTRLVTAVRKALVRAGCVGGI